VCSGFVSLGSLAGELEDPVRSYWLAILMLVPLVLIVNCMPLIVSMSLDHDRNHFQPGHFQVLATGVVGHWMKAVYFTGSQIPSGHGASGGMPTAPVAVRW
jgi:hypothetical protein